MAATRSIFCSSYARALAHLQLRFRDLRIRRKHIALALLAGLLLVLLGIGVGWTLVRIFGRPATEDLRFLNQDISWQSSCEQTRKCAATFVFLVLQ